MSKIFFDHLIEIEEIEVYIKNISQTHEERIDLWETVDEFVNGRILSLIYDALDEEFHEEFTNIFLDRPYDTAIINYLDGKMTCPFCELIGRNKNAIISDLHKIFEVEDIKSKPKKRK